MDINKLKSQLAAMQEEINRTAEQYGLGGHLQHMLNGGEIHQLPVMPYGFAKDGSYMTNTKVYSPEELKTMKLNQATSIVDAMKLMGDDPSFANRKKMAEEMGIKDYTGTDDQNNALMQKYYSSKRQPSDTVVSEDVNELAASSPQRELEPMESLSPNMLAYNPSETQAPEQPTYLKSMDMLPQIQHNGSELVQPEESQMEFPEMYSRKPFEKAPIKLPEVVVKGKRPVPHAPVKTAPVRQAAPVKQQPVLKTTNFNSLSNFSKTTQDIINEAAKRNNGKVFVTDKGTKTTIVGTVKNGKVDLQAFPVLTGQQDKPGMYPNSYSYESVGDYEGGRHTPTGAFALDERTIYGQPGLGLRGTDDAYHVTYPGEYNERTPKYTDANINNNNMSYGCINGRCGDVATLTKMFNTGDSSYVIDTRLPYNQNIKMINTNKHKKITREMGGMNSDQSDMYYAGGNIPSHPETMHLYGFEQGGEVMELPIAPYGYASEGMEIPIAPYGYNKDGGMAYEDGGQLPMDIAVARFKAAAKDKGLSGGEAMAYVEKMKSKYNYQAGGAVKESDVSQYDLAQYGNGGIMFDGNKFPGYNKPIATPPGDKHRKMMILKKGGKVKLVKFGHR